MNMKILGITLTAFVSLVVLAGVLMPILEDAEHYADNTYTNAAPYSYGKVYDFDENSDDMVVISICKSGERSISINGESHTVSSYQPVVLSDAFTIRYYSYSMSFVTPSAGNKTIISATITISGGIATFSDVLNASETEITIDPEPITWAFIHDPTGEWAGIITENGVDIYAHKNEIYTSNWINTTSEYFSSKAGTTEATITDGSDSYTTPINWGGQYLDDGVYKLHLASDSTDYTFVVDNNGADYTVHPFIVCAPKTVVGTPDDQSRLNEIYDVIPLLIIVAILLGVVALVIRSKLD